MITIGRNTYTPGDTQYRFWLPTENIIIGNFCSIADQVMICAGGQHRTDLVSSFPFGIKMMNYPTDPVYKTTMNTTIGSDVWIGTKSVIIGGVNVGHGAVIATASVVLTDVPPYAVVAGNPAKVMRFRFSKSLVERMLKIAWWDWSDDIIKANVSWFYKPALEFVNHFDPNGE